MSSRKKSLIKTILTANGGCGCTKPKASRVHEPSPKPKISINHDQNPNLRISLTNSSSTSGEPNAFLSPDLDVFTCTSISEPEIGNKNYGNMPMLKKSPKLVDSVAVEKDSEDPYEDFRYSMLQMIFEKEMYSEADLQDLLQCFIQLNPPSHHDIILRAFADICEEAFSKKKKKLTRA